MRLVTLFALFGCVGPAGEDGSPGPRGEQGIAGPAGPEGPPGASAQSLVWADSTGQLLESSTSGDEAVYVDSNGWAWRVDVETGTPFGYGFGPIEMTLDVLFAEPGCAGPTSIPIPQSLQPRMPFKIVGDTTWYVRPDDMARPGTGTAYASYRRPDGACVAVLGSSQTVLLSQVEAHPEISTPTLGLVGPLHMERP